MFLHLEQVEPRTGHRLFVRFDNGISGELSLFEELWGEMFLPLRNEAAFQTAQLDPVMQTVVWANGADFAPEFLLDLLNKQIGNAA